MFRLTALIRENMDRLAASITLEQSKTFIDAKGDVLRGLQVCETACGVTTQLTGEVIEVTKDMETRSYREPLGIVAAICPFNFPAMIPLWSIPIATVTGNCLILKPSQRDPGAAMILAELCKKAGMPDGVVSCPRRSQDGRLHGSMNRQLRQSPLSAPTARVNTFFMRGSANGKRVQANLGAKNHAAVLPDANRNHALNAITGAAFGAAGQRCMALSILVTVGETKEWLPEIVERAKALKVDCGFEPDVDLGPLISPQSKKRLEDLITSVVQEAATILLDGRGFKPEKYPNGNWVSTHV